ncbi:hypothetical protein DPMN_184569 [Dreissena polymorpha]|uniref:Uncharacterized protein n=1 Tax=Dreissena polymorpha TaxID=45954 RepID=A0A9D4I7J4_DREPO|nr:hypothetical protein DPMN_184569 [Dreissena polymorpha]
MKLVTFPRYASGTTTEEKVRLFKEQYSGAFWLFRLTSNGAAQAAVFLMLVERPQNVGVYKR